MTARPLPRFARRAASVDTIDHALLLELRLRDRPCCRCPAADHDAHGCRGCGACRVTYADHPDRAASEELAAWRETGTELARWTRDWYRDDPPEDQRRPGPAAGELPWRP